MRLDLLVLFPLILGHLALTVLAINVIHALGHADKILEKLTIVVALAFIVGAGLIGWEAWTGSIDSWSWPARLYGGLCAISGLVILPVSTAMLHRRSEPDVIRGRETLIDLAEDLGTERLIGAGKNHWMLRLPGNQSLRLSKVEVEVSLPNLPRSLDGLSVLHLSDLHFSSAYSRGYFEVVFAEASRWESDLVVFTGDLLDDDATTEWIVPLFSTLRGKLGSFSILGNHDMKHRPENLRRLIEEAGFSDLDGRWETVRSQDATIALGGSSYPWGPPLALADRPRADYRIFLCHSPDQYYRAERAGFHLMLSGHNHGGQIRFPILGAVFMPSVYSRRFDRGFFRKNGLTLHVSQGVGGKHPVRYGCTPEITRLVLRCVVSEASEKPTSGPETLPVSARSQEPPLLGVVGEQFRFRSTGPG